MIRTVNIVLTVTALLALIGVYGLKYSVEETASRRAELERKIERQQSDLSLLQADWAYLTQPSQIEPIIRRHQQVLGLEITKQAQIGSFDALPMRPAKPDSQALDALFQALNEGIDPIEALIEAN